MSTRPPPSSATRRGGTRRGLALAAVSLAALLPGLAHAQEGPGRRMPDRGGGHVPEGQSVPYPSYPPTSGPHWPRPAPWGVYDFEIAPEVYVHNLEHGGIVVLYHCPRPCPDLVEKLRRASATLPRSKYGHVKLLVTPVSILDHRLAFLAWTWIEELDDFDQGRLLRFYKAHVDRGPEDVP